MGYFTGFKRCLSTHPCAPQTPEILSLPVQRRGLLLQSPTVRPVHISESVHSRDQGNISIFTQQRDQGVCLSGRLVNSGRLQGGISQGDKPGVHSSPGAGLGDQQGQVGPSTQSRDYLPGGLPELQDGRGKTIAGQGICLNVTSEFVNQQKQSTGSGMVATLGPYGKSSGCTSILSLIHEADPGLPTPSFQAVSGSHVEEGTDAPRSETTPGMVEVATQCGEGDPIPPNQTAHNHYDRRISGGLGGCLGSSHISGPVVPGGIELAHQSPGTGRHPQSDPDMGPGPSGSAGHCLLRQHNGSGIHKQARRDEVVSPLRKDLGPSPSLSSVEHLSPGISPGGLQECNGRRPLQGFSRQQRMEPESDLGRSCVQSIRQTVSGPVCNRGQCPITDVLFQEVSPDGLGNRRIVDFMGQSVRVRFSAILPNQPSASQVQELQGRAPAHRTPLAETVVVPPVTVNASRSTVQVPLSQATSDAEEGQSLAPQPRGSTPVSMEVVNKRLQEAGLPTETAQIAANSRRASTVATYDSRLERYSKWAHDHSLDPLGTSVDQVSEFFMSLYREGRQVSTIRNYRSALSAVHKGFPDGTTVGSNPVIGQLLRGMFNKRPPQKRLAPSWSINDVLTSLCQAPYEPMQNAPLEHLTHKTLFLVAAASARRRSELHALTVKRGYIRFDPAGVRLLPDPGFLSKNQSPSFVPGEIFLPSIATTSSIREDRLVCPVRALKWYIEKTKAVRTSDKLFVIPRPPFQPASKDTISKWLVRLITPHASQEDQVRAHDVRAHTTSSAWFRGVPMDEIMKAAAWKTPSTFVASYLTDVVSSEGTFARSVLQGPSRRPPTRGATLNTDVNRR